MSRNEILVQAYRGMVLLTLMEADGSWTQAPLTRKQALHISRQLRGEARLLRKSRPSTPAYEVVGAIEVASDEPPLFEADDVEWCTQ